MGNTCSSACISDGSTLDTAIVKCKNMPCKCTLSCFKSIKEDIQVADHIKELIEVTVLQQIANLKKSFDDNNDKPDLPDGLP